MHNTQSNLTTVISKFLLVSKLKTGFDPNDKHFSQSPRARCHGHNKITSQQYHTIRSVKF